MAIVDQALLLELDAHPSATAEELEHALHGATPLPAVAHWLSAHEGWLVVREAAGWRLSSQGEGFLAALD